MNSNSTEHGPYEYDRTKLKEHIDSHWGEQRIDSNAELNDFLHRQQGQPYDRNSDLIGRPYQQPYFAMKMSDEEYLEFVRALKQREARIDEAASGMLALLILVFAGAVLWKVWVG